MTATVEAAYVACESITRTEARNFSYGIRLLPPPRRAALSAVYALARRIDDIGDGELPVADKLAQLAQLRAAVRDIDRASDPVLVAVADAARRLPIPLGAFDELIDGVELDAVGAGIADFDALVHYGRCVAGSVGRLCLGVFGSSDPAAAAGYADTLGIALQQTNILRDVREDLRNGRIYLPADELERHRVVLRLDATGSLADDEGRLTRYLVSFAGRNRDWYDVGVRLLPLLDRRSAACAAAMSGIYRRLLDRITQRPSLVLDRRLTLSTPQKLSVAVGAMLRRPA